MRVDKDNSYPSSMNTLQTIKVQHPLIVFHEANEDLQKNYGADSLQETNNGLKG